MLHSCTCNRTDLSERLLTILLDPPRMSSMRSHENDIFRNVIEIGLRMYGNGYPSPAGIVELIRTYCRQILRQSLVKHNQLIDATGNHRLSLLSTLIYTSRHKKARLKRLQQFLQAKDRQEQQQQEETADSMSKRKAVSIGDRFSRICYQIQLDVPVRKNRVRIVIDSERSETSLSRCSSPSNRVWTVNALVNTLVWMPTTKVTH